MDVCGFRSDDERWELACVRHLMRGGFNKDNSGGWRLCSVLDVVHKTHTHTHRVHMNKSMSANTLFYTLRVGSEGSRVSHGTQGA